MRYLFSLLCISLFFSSISALSSREERSKRMHQRRLEKLAKMREGHNAQMFWQAMAFNQNQKELLERPVALHQKVSLIVPCYYKHAPLLYDLLVMYEYQTKLPDEVVISLSQVDLVDPAVFEQLVTERWAFPVKLVVTNQQKYGGENRNIACAHASGDILVCQDADDIVHDQRLEVLHYFFAHYAIDHLIHEYRMVKPNEESIAFMPYAPGEIQFCSTENFQSIWRLGRFTNGAVAITKDLFDYIQWPNTPRGQDTEFNKAVYKNRSKKCIVLNAILYGYRQYLSSQAKEDVEEVREAMYIKKPDQIHAVELIRS